jgi:thiol-disulfide isomerase/thioredoxin
MASFQNAAPGAKSMKFADALNPFAPFLGQEPAEEEVPPSLTEQFDNRLRLDGQQHTLSSASSSVPSGASAGPFGQNQKPDASHSLENSGQQQQRLVKPSIAKKNGDKVHNQDCDDDSEGDSDFEDDDDDPTLEAFRQKRLAELRKAQMKQAENKARGHGEVRTITQDEFLPECTSSSEFVAIHFFHEEFERCKIMDHHLKRIAPQHLSCKFLRIDAEKAPFFVVKLKIQTLPTLVIFKDGKSIDRLVGFENLADVTSKDPDDFPTSRLGYWLEKTGAIEYEGPQSEDEDDYKQSSRKSNGGHRFRANDEDI